MTSQVVSNVSNESLYLLNPNAYVNECLVNGSTSLYDSICPIVSLAHQIIVFQCFSNIEKDPNIKCNLNKTYIKALVLKILKVPQTYFFYK